MEHPIAIRFAPVGFQRSRCFRESRDFSCVTCHDPHGNVRKEPEFYRTVCSGCHGNKPRQTPCPVQPRGDCVSCHMPRAIIQRNGIFTDHWIRVPARDTNVTMRVRKLLARRTPTRRS